MLFAQKNVLASLFAASTLLISLTPSAHAESTANSKSQYPIQAEAKVVAEPCSISDLPLTKLETYIPTAKIASYSLNSARLNDMRSLKLKVNREDKANYAVERVLESTDTASVEAETKAPVIVQSEIKTELDEPIEYSLNAEVLFTLINEHRVKIGIQPLVKDDKLMQIASERAPELFDEIFVNGNMHAGFYARNLPYYATENIIYNRTEIGALNWWLGSAIHRSAIQNSEHTYTGIACSGRTCSQIFSHFQPK